MNDAKWLAQQGHECVQRRKLTAQLRAALTTADDLAADTAAECDRLAGEVRTLNSELVAVGERCLGLRQDLLDVQKSYSDFRDRAIKRERSFLERIDQLEAEIARLKQEEPDLDAAATQVVCVRPALDMEDIERQRDALARREAFGG